MLSHSPHGWVRLLLAPASHYLFSLFQGTNGSQLWDTAFAIQAFLEVMHPSVLHAALGKWSLLVSVQIAELLLCTLLELCCASSGLASCD